MVTTDYSSLSLHDALPISEMALVLGSLLVYTWQQRHEERELRNQAATAEKRARKDLEALVDARTQDLNIALHEAHEANRNKTFFLGRVTHDLKSPLTSIMGYSQLLAVKPGEVGLMGQFIHGSAEHMNQLINRLVNYSKEMGKDEIELESIYFHKLLSDVEKSANIMAKRNDNKFV